MVLFILFAVVRILASLGTVAFRDYSKRISVFSFGTRGQILLFFSLYIDMEHAPIAHLP
jgi:hypothetical protein